MMILKFLRPATLPFLAAYSIWHASWEDLSEDYSCGEFLITDDFGNLVKCSPVNLGCVIQKYQFH